MVCAFKIYNSMKHCNDWHWLTGTRCTSK